MSADNYIGGRKVFDETDRFQKPQQVAHIIQRTWRELGPPCRHAHDDAEVILFDKRDHVTVRVHTAVSDGVQVRLEVLPTEPQLAVSSFSLLLRHLSGRWQWLPGDDESNPGLQVYTTLDSEPMGKLEEASLVSQITELRRWCDALCPVRCEDVDQGEINKKYKPFEKVMKPIFPWTLSRGCMPDALIRWAEEVLELVQAGFPVGVCRGMPVERRLALALVAERGLSGGVTLGQLTLSGISPEKLLQLVQEAPGIVVVPTRALEMNTNPYERGDAVKNLLRTLADEFSPCLFEGAYGEHQALFHGGQGAENDPLNPVVCHIPEIPLELLARFALWDTGQRLGLPLPTDMDAAVAQVRRVLSSCASKASRLLPSVAEKILRGQAGEPDIVAFVERVSGRNETFGAVGIHHRIPRSGETQHRFQQRLTSPAFKQYLLDRLFGQEEALNAYVNRLQEEVLTRPLYQPLALALQGTPGTGKSETLGLTADYLELPYIVIDAASIPDTYTGMAQLLGSGRGIVGSHQSGRLEQVAKHHLGAVVEIADIDHAPPSVRNTLGDLFLQIMQTGEAQSSIGSMFSCAGLLLGFTLNLPGGKDEKAYQRLGFGNAPTMAEVRREVRREIKSMVSGAFLSRLGEPVLFSPLSESACIAIVRIALERAALTGLERLGSTGVSVEIEEDVVVELVRRFDSSLLTFGARGLVDMARGSIVNALLPWRDACAGRQPDTVRITLSTTGTLEFSEAITSTKVLTTME